jgi:hypothetical protein
MRLQTQSSQFFLAKVAHRHNFPNPGELSKMRSGIPAYLLLQVPLNAAKALQQQNPFALLGVFVFIFIITGIGEHSPTYSLIH